jgi:hypothetical protein
MVDVAGADLLFEVAGSGFSWSHFSADQISGQVHWIGETLLLTNIQAEAYVGGDVTGWAFFDFRPEKGADFRFHVESRDVDLARLLMPFRAADASRVEGLLDGSLTVTSANTEDWQSWNGSGHAALREGLLWEIPMLGVFSSAFNAFSPGLGSTRASEARGTFLIQDSVIFSDDLEIRAPALRLRYRGTIDFQTRVDARIEAEILRDAWIVGRLVSAALTPFTKIFEYQITGTLESPVHEPAYIPKLFMLPLRPFHTLKTLLPEIEAPAAGNGNGRSTIEN